MNDPRGFRYPLEPIMLTRQWDLDAVTVELGERRLAVEGEEAVAAQLQLRLTAVQLQWQALGAGGGACSVDQFAMFSRFMADLAAQIRASEERTAALVVLREEALERTLQARRALDAVEQHRKEMQKQFRQVQLSGEIRNADDQWTTLKCGMAEDGSND